MGSMPTRTCHQLLSSGDTNHLELLATGGCSTYRPMGKALKGDSPEVEVVLTRHSQRHARTRSTILNSSFVLRPGARLRNKVHPTLSMGGGGKTPLSGTKRLVPR